MAAKTGLNIEVGDRLVTVCHAAKSGRRLRVLGCFQFPTPDQTVSDGAIVDPKALAEVLREQLALHRVVAARSVTFTLATSKVASREVLLPPMKEQRLKEVVETNARDYFPVDMSNYQVAFNLLERVSEPNPGCRVLVMAAPKPLLMGYFRLAEQAGLRLEGIDYGGNSQYQLLRQIPGSALTMYVDVNVGSTTVSFLRGPVLLLQRVFNFGGDELISAVQRARGGNLSYPEALALASDEEGLQGLLSHADRDDALARLVTGIARSADFFTSSHTGTPVEQVVLMGACGGLSGLREMVHHALDRDTTTLTELPGVEFTSRPAEGVAPYLSCVGSMLQPLNLIPDEVRRRGRSTRGERQKNADSITFGVVACCLCVLAGGIFSGLSVFRYLDAAGREATLQRRMDELSYVTQTYDTYINYKTMAENLAAVDGFAATPNAELTAFFQEMERKMPSSILVLSAVCTPDGITMNVTVPGMEAVAVVLDQLRSFESVESLSVSTITETTDETGYTTAAFSVSCVYLGHGPVEEVPAAPAETPAPAESGQ